jgi:hypothetical protein
LRSPVRYTNTKRKKRVSQKKRRAESSETSGVRRLKRLPRLKRDWHGLLTSRFFSHARTHPTPTMVAITVEFR